MHLCFHDTPFQFCASVPWPEEIFGYSVSIGTCHVQELISIKRSVRTIRYGVRILIFYGKGLGVFDSQAEKAYKGHAKCQHQGPQHSRYRLTVSRRQWQRWRR